MDVISEERNTKQSEQSSVAAVLISEGANTQNLAIESGYSSGPKIYPVVQTSTPDQKAEANCTSLHKDQKDLSFGCNLCGVKFFKERHWEYHVLLKHRNGMLKTQQQTSVSSVTSRVSNSEKKHAKILRLSDKYNKMRLSGFAKPKLPEHYSIKSSEKEIDSAAHKDT